MDLDLKLDESSSLPRYRQIYGQLRDMIMTGKLPAGMRLPPSRKLAKEHNLARVTVTSAYDQLRAEGYVISQIGAGTFVAPDLPLIGESTTAQTEIYEPSFSFWGRRVLGTSTAEKDRKASPRPAIDFGFGRSFPHIFPYDTWRRLLARYLSTDDTMLSRYGSVAGFDPLREAVTDYLGRMRGVDCTADQVVIVNGMQQALDILSRLLLNNQDEVLVETPGYADAFKLFRTFGAKLHALPVDEHGFPVEKIPAG